jgi:cation transport ATPase
MGSPRTTQRLRGNVNRNDLGAAMRKRGGEVALATADIQHTRGAIDLLPQSIHPLE